MFVSNDAIFDKPVVLLTTATLSSRDGVHCLCIACDDQNARN